MNSIEKQLKKSLLTSREKYLMEVLFESELTEDIMNILMDRFDIDKANQNYTLMLACLGYREGWRFFPKEMIPRLKGVHRYYQVQNSIGLPWLIQQLKILSDTGIPIMLIKGMAMRTYYDKGTPRLMWDYDIAVPEERYQDALQLLCKGRNFLKGEWNHSGAISNGKEEVDIHRWIFKENEEKNSDFWMRAIYFNFHDINVCVPSPEDMFLHQLDTQLYNWFRNEAPERRMKWLYDCRCIWSFLKEEDLYKLSVRAEELHMKYKIGIMFRLFASCFPDLISQSILYKYFAPTKEEYRWIKMWKKYKREVERYTEYLGTHKIGTVMTPGHSFRLIKLEKAYYYYHEPELWRADPNINLWKYFKETRNLGSFWDALCFLIKYISHIRIRKK